MREKNKKQSLRTAICLMLVLAMLATILPENVQAASSAASFTTDLVDLNGWEMIRAYGKAGKGGVSFPSTSLGIPEGETVYVIDGRSTCEGKQLYRVYYEGRVWSAYSNNILNLKDTAWIDAYLTKQNRELKGKKVKAKKDAVVGNVMDPLHYYHVYAKPKVSDKNCIGAVCVGDTMQIINANYNSKWAEVLWKSDYVGYIQKDCLNYADAYLGYLGLRSQQDVKQAKKAKLTFNGILKDYDKKVTRKEFCRLVVNWYKATGHKLPKQSKKSPYVDTKDSYVIMAYQLGFIQSTSDKKFQPDKKVSCTQGNKMMKSMLSAAKVKNKVYPYVKFDFDVTREGAIRNLYRAYKMVQKKDYLITSGSHVYNDLVYTISPADNPNVCLDDWEWSDASGAEIGLYTKTGNKNQKFVLYNVNGFTTITNVWSQKTLNGTTQKVYQDYKEYEAEKMRFEYNNDGTVCIINGDGLYLDIKDGQAVSGAHLIFAPKSGSSTQKWVFTAQQYG